MPRVVHFEIHASVPQKLIDFYSRLLGWQFQNYGGGDQPYWVIDTGEGSINNAAGQRGLGINGGLVPRQGPRPELGAPVAGCNIVVGQIHFIKTVEDIYEAIVNTVPQMKFGIAFNEASGACLTRVDGNDPDLKSNATRNQCDLGTDARS